jgi:hypothetical protein
MNAYVSPGEPWIKCSPVYKYKVEVEYICLETGMVERQHTRIEKFTLELIEGTRIIQLAQYVVIIKTTRISV